jgi:integrase
MKTIIDELIQADGSSKFILKVRYPNGNRRRLLFKGPNAKRDAEREAASLHTQLKVGGSIWASLTQRQQAEMLFVFKEARDLGVSMFDLLECYKEHNGDAKKKATLVPLRQMIQETIDTARAKNYVPRYIELLGSTLTSFADGRESLPVQHVTFADIEKWLANQKGVWRPGAPRTAAAPSTISGLRGRLSAMFTEAVRRDYIYADANPMRKVIKPKIAPKPPEFLTVPHVHDLLWVCRQTASKFLPYLVLGVFAGIRPEELAKLHWNHIDLDRGEILIDENVVVGRGNRHRRIIEMKEKGEIRPEFQALYAWLHLCPTRTGYIVPVDGDRKTGRVMRQIKQWVERYRKRISVRAGVKLGQDILRKTACTYLMLRLQNEHKVAMILGNSPRVIFTHYRGLGRREQADAFLNLTPDNVKNDPLTLGVGGQGKTAGKIIL